MIVMGVDPGKQGGFCLLEDSKLLNFAVMPLNTSKEPCFTSIQGILNDFNPDHIFLERAVAFGMGCKSAFNYGRGFASLEIAISLTGKPVTYVDPSKWTREMHEGTTAKLKSKEKSIIAFERLFARFAQQIPKSKNGKMHEGILDALLIAAYGQRKLS